MKTVQLNVRVKKELRDEIQGIAEEVGLSLSDIVNLQFAKLARERTLEIKASQKAKSKKDLLKSIKKNQFSESKYKSGLDLQNKVRS